LCWEETVSKNQRMPAVKAAPFVPADLISRFDEAGRRRGFRVEPLTTVAGCPLIALTKRVPGPRPRCYVSSGVHGDEPSGPLALLNLLESEFFDDRAVWFLMPLLNPTGFERGIRENDQSIDLNRDYRHRQTQEVAAHVHWLQYQPRFDVSFCLHEDWEATGFYLYELNPDRLPSLAEPIVARVGRKFPIDLHEIIDGRPASGGIIRPESDPVLRDYWPEAIYLCAHHTSRGYTLESPSSHLLEQRIEMHVLAMTEAMERISTLE